MVLSWEDPKSKAWQWEPGPGADLFPCFLFLLVEKLLQAPLPPWWTNSPWKEKPRYYFPLLCYLCQEKNGQYRTWISNRGINLTQLQQRQKYTEEMELRSSIFTSQADHSPELWWVSHLLLIHHLCESVVSPLCQLVVGIKYEIPECAGNTHQCVNRRSLPRRTMHPAAETGHMKDQRFSDP